MLNISQDSPDQLYAAAVQHHMAGRAAEAERLYRRLLAAAPDHADGWHMLGALAFQHGKLDAAIGCMGRAVALNLRVAVYRANLGETCSQAGRHAEAESHFKAAITLDGRLVNAYTNLAALLIRVKRPDEALQAAQGALAIAPDNPAALRFAGDALLRLERHAEARGAYERALAIDPQLTDARFNLGLLHLDQGRFEAAAEAFRQVIAAKPDETEARLQLVDALDRLGRGEEVYAAMTDFLRRHPGSAKGHAKFANLLRGSNRLDEALLHYDQAVGLAPEDWVTQANRAFALRDLARLDEAVAILQEQVAAHPERASLHSGLIFTMQLAPDLRPEDLAGQHHLWNRRHSDPVAAQRRSHSNPREPERRLRIGYLSPDLRSHPVGRFMLPLIRNHNRAAVEVFCFQASRVVDTVTEEIRAAADHFVPLGGIGDDKAAALIRASAIDILIDLSNHTIDNRLLVFARKPAPVQISYLAFCAGTGLETIDWRLTDPHIDPLPPTGTTPASAGAFERPLHLAETYWCYAAHSAAGAVMPLPAVAANGGRVTFGAFNYFSKCNQQVLALWADLLAAVPGARLRLHAPPGSREAHVRQFFESRGIEAGRLELIGRVREDAYFENYGQIDIALDPFPWAGGTTTCDALYMGVPVITLAPAPGAIGQTLQRGGVSILTNLGHPEWIAHSREDYIARARSLADDLAKLAEIRGALRPQMQASVLMDAPRFARHIEAAYRHAWRVYCAS